MSEVSDTELLSAYLDGELTAEEQALRRADAGRQRRSTAVVEEMARSAAPCRVFRSKNLTKTYPSACCRLPSGGCSRRKKRKSPMGRTSRPLAARRRR